MGERWGDERWGSEKGGGAVYRDCNLISNININNAVPLHATLTK